MRNNNNVLLKVENLKTYFYTDAGIVKAVDGVSFNIYKGEALGIVGESGCGKSVTALSIMRLIDEPAGKIVSGDILFEDKNLLKLSLSEIRDIRGNKIGMIFQEPMTSLNPVYTIGDQIIEAIILHLGKSYEEAKAMAINILKQVGISSPERRINEYPHQMSGGMKQRVMIAMCLVCNPKLLIADEPTTALDVTIQSQILDIMRDIQKDFHMSILLITHNLGVIAEIAHRVVVMYAGRIVEIAEVIELFEKSNHPYTIGLFESIPKIDKEQKVLQPIPGVVPNPLEFPSGCKFHPRCKYNMDICKLQEPILEEIASGHWSACWLNKRK